VSTKEECSDMLVVKAALSVGIHIFTLAIFET